MKKTIILLLLTGSLLGYSQDSSDLVTFKHVGQQSELHVYKFNLDQNPTSYDLLKSDLVNSALIEKVDIRESEKTIILYSKNTLSADKVRKTLHKNGTEFDRNTVKINDVKQFFLTKNEQ